MDSDGEVIVFSVRFKVYVVIRVPQGKVSLLIGTQFYHMNLATQNTIHKQFM